MPPPHRIGDRIPEHLEEGGLKEGVELLEYVREAHRSMKVLEQALETRLHAIWAGETPATDAAEAEAEPQAQAGRVAAAAPERRCPLAAGS